MDKKSSYQKLLWATAMYEGISKQIRFEINHGTKDRVKDMQYLVDRYCDELMVSGKYLQELLREYIKVVKERKDKYAE